MNQDNQAIKFENNPYQYIRGIRFRAHIGERESDSFKEKYETIGNEEDAQSDLSELEKLLSDFHRDLKSLLYDTGSKPEEEKFCKKLSVNKTWLKRWHKELFYLLIKRDNNKQGKYTLKDLQEILPIFNQKLDQWSEHSEEIEKASKASKNERFRHSDIATAIRDLLSQELLAYIRDFLMEVHTKSTELDEHVKKLKKDVENIQKQLKKAAQKYLSSQSSGIEIAKASFNYYTVNKKPKEYYEQEHLTAKDQLYKNYFSKIKTEEYSWEFVNKSCSGGHKNNSQKPIFTFKSSQEKEWIEKYCKKYLNADDLKEEVCLTLDQTYSAMKAFKAEQKSIFYEIMAHIASEEKKNSSYENKNSNHLLKGWRFPYNHQNVQEMNKAFSLFQFKEKKLNNSHFKKILSPYQDGNNKVTADKCFEAFVDLTRQIQQSGTKKNKKPQMKKPLHPKHRFLAQRKNRFKGDSSVGFYNNNKDTIPYKSQRPKQDRGVFLFGNGCYFKEYGCFCEKYKKVAQKRGLLNAQIKGIEKEKLEALQIDFWSLIYCNEEKRQLWLVPKTKYKEAKSFIYSPKRKNSASEDSQYLSCFESLTMRALHKLCFAEQSSFVKDMRKDNRVSMDIKNLQKEIKEFKTANQEPEVQEKKSQKKLEFFKELLNSEYAKESLLLKNFDLKNCYNAKNLEEFEKSLETACYHVKKITLTEGEKQDFLKKHDVTVLNISSYDLEERNKNTYQTPVSANRYHTDLWQAFWKRDRTTVKGFTIGEVRLNPEVKIRYRKADEDLKKYFDKKNFPSKFKHRKLQEGFTAHFTLAVNAGKRYEELAFAKPEKLLNKINDFNQKLSNEMNFKTAWKYGIDRGQKELATLCLVRFNPDKELYEINNKTIVKPAFPKDDKDSETIKCWTLKNSNYKEEYTTKKSEKRTRWAIKNLSYFVDEKYLNDKELFEEKNIACLDLTTAKVIKGKIITNGDVLTYLKLKKAVAKRQLYNLFQTNKIKENVSMGWSEQENGSTKDERHRPEGVLNIKTSNGEETIYYYRKEYEGTLINKEKNIKYSQQSIKDSLNHYLNQLRQNNQEHTPEILKINHLRDAITANMVGVICHLQKTYPGFVILEDLTKDSIDWHRSKNEENISRRLENALYNKFQSLGLVPPHVKDIIQLRENNKGKDENNTKNKNKLKKANQKNKESNEQATKLNQIGAIVFVDKTNTSQDCPYCEETLHFEKKDKQRKNEEKFKQHRFICGDHQPCGFDTYHFKKKEDRAKGYTPEPDKAKYKESFKWFEALDDPDKVAAYNVAKKITKPEEIGKLTLNKKSSKNNKEK